ncbi:phosphotriesterase-related protein [Novosphingobium sp. CF614]|uniref:phosphotriesterase family protein n=1 Tax=Novosphingobium sp. CF614 TaxID=1884364 RepID=UPI0008F19104|nr:phosphotriesterase [Novosphingobium sp. CF614]SFF77334.1 phosphotriesterase-related protein [Novosphingobium sp. CF614]
MTVIQTARGPIAASALGRVLVHEHVFSNDLEYTLNYRPDFVEDQQIVEAARRLDAVKACGIDTIMDLTVLGLGRNVPSIVEVAKLTQVNIIVATGCYTIDDVPRPLAQVGPGLMFDRPDPLPDMFVRDIEEGIYGTQVKAAILKCAIDMPGLRPGVERVMRAVGNAHVRTGAPITVHTAARQEMGLVAQRVLKEEGVDLRDVIIGHCGDTTDIDYLMRLADEGSILAMDRFGMNTLLPLEKRVATIVELVGRGYVDRLTLSHDCFCWSDFFPSEEDRVRYFPEHSYCYIPQTAVPALLEAGITQDEVDTMQIVNPRRHFEDAARRFAGRARSSAAAAVEA